MLLYTVLDSSNNKVKWKKNSLYSYNPSSSSSSSSSSTSSVYGDAATPTPNTSSYMTSSSRSLNSNQYIPSSIRYSFAIATKHSTSAAMYNCDFHYSTFSSAPNAMSHLISQSSWSDASNALAALKRSSNG